MKCDQKIGLGLGILALGLASCTALGAAASVVGTAFTGASYVQSQTVERTFSAPMPEVQQACRQAIEAMAFTIKVAETGENTYHIVAVAPGDYEVEITITRITPNATKVAVNADSLPNRDKATGQEIIDQIASALSPPVLAFPTVKKEEASQLTIDVGPPAIPLVGTVQPAPPESPSNTSPQLAAKREPPMDWPSVGQEPPPIASRRVDGQAEIANFQEIYDSGIRAYIEGDFPIATTHFRRYLAAQPQNGQTPKALYWLGESLYNQRKYADALLQYETILRDYPGSPEVPRALYRGAQVYRKLGETSRAEALHEMLILEHPQSWEAHLTGPTAQAE